MREGACVNMCEARNPPRRDRCSALVADCGRMSHRKLLIGLAIQSAVRGVHFSCPTCSQDLIPVAGGNSKHLKCNRGHVTDVAKEGHVFLMPKSKRKSDPEVQAAQDAMVRAGRAFYESDGFSTQIDAVAGEVIRAVGLVPPDGVDDGHHVLNVGCGEGVYLRRLEGLLRAQGAGTPLIELWGTDPSKLAARYAAKRQPNASVAVALPHRLPFADGVFSVVFATFANCPWEEVCRVLKPGGAVIVARAGRRHLDELRHLAHTRGGGDASLARAARAPSEPKQFSSGLAEHYIRSTTEESYQPEVMRSLLAMTPYTRHLLELEHGVQHSDLEGMTTTVDFICSTHRVWLGTGGEPE